MNQALEVIENRFSCRGYTGEKVEHSLIEQMAQAAMAAPSALNGQHWRVVFLNDKAVVDEVSAYALSLMKAMPDQSTYNRIMERGGNPFYNAPAIAFVYKEKGKGAMVDIDCGILVQNLSLSATSLGLGNVIAAMVGMIFTGPEGEAFKEKLHMPENFEFGISLIFGHGNLTKAPHEKDMEKVTYL